MPRSPGCFRSRCSIGCARSGCRRRRSSSRPSTTAPATSGRPTSLYGADDYVEQHHIPDLLLAKLATLLGLPMPDGEKVDGGGAARRRDHPRGGEARLSIRYRDRDEGLLRARRLARLIVADIALYNRALGSARAGRRRSSGAAAQDLEEGRLLFDLRVPRELRDGEDFMGDALHEFYEGRRRGGRGGRRWRSRVRHFGSASGSPAMNIVETLGSPDEEVRRAAVASLAGGDAELALLMYALGDESWRVRKEAALRASTWANQERAAACSSRRWRSATTWAGVMPRWRRWRASAGRARATLAALGTSRPIIASSSSTRSGSSPIGAPPRARRGAGRSRSQRALRGCRVARADRWRRGGGALSTGLDERDLLVSLACLEALNLLGSKLPLARLIPLLSTTVLRPDALEAIGNSRDPEAARRCVHGWPTNRAPCAKRRPWPSIVSISSSKKPPIGHCAPPLGIAPTPRKAARWRRPAGGWRGL